MGDVVKIFLSATSGDLGTVRELVKQGLLTMHCLPVEQTNFAPDYRTVAGMLEERIRGCEAVIHLVGLRYGTEPDPASLPPGGSRRSFTQMEADIARKLGKKLYVFLCPHQFPFDPCEAEPEDKATLQLAYRQEVASQATLHTQVNDRHDVAERVRELQIDLERVRERLARHRRRTFAIAGVFSLVLVALTGFVWWNARRTPDLIEARIEQAMTYDPVRIRVNLEQQIRKRSEEEIGKLDAVRDWEKIAELEKGRDQQLADVGRFLEEMGKAYDKKEASANYNTASQILAEKGVTEALRFLEVKSAARGTKIEALKRTRDQQEKSLRELLRENLLKASLLEKDGQYERAEAEYRAIIGDSGAWAEPRNQLSLLIVRYGQTTDPAEGNRKFVEAAELCRGTIATTARVADPQGWAGAHSCLANSLSAQAYRAGGTEGQRMLAEAVSMYRLALEAYTREESPQEWAMTQISLGNALNVQGPRALGPESERLLAEAVLAYREALVVYTKEQYPKEWATTHASLGFAFVQQANRTEGNKLRALSSAEYRTALEVFTPEAYPQEWRRCIMWTLGNLEKQERQRVIAAIVAAERADLRVHTRERSPADWAARQAALGGILIVQGEYAEAAVAFRGALEVRTKEQIPQAWADDQIQLGIALSKEGKRVGGEEGVKLLRDAVASTRAALEVRTREELPHDWALTLRNIANRLVDLASHTQKEESQRLIAEAVQNYRLELAVSREQCPARWEQVQSTMAGVLLAEGKRVDGEDGVRMIGQAVVEYRALLEVRTRKDRPEDWARTQDTLGRALHDQATHSEGEASQRLLVESVAAFTAALEVRAPDRMPSECAATRRDLLITLKELSKQTEGAERDRWLAEVKRIEGELKVH